MPPAPAVPLGDAPLDGDLPKCHACGAVGPFAPRPDEGTPENLCLATWWTSRKLDHARLRDVPLSLPPLPGNSGEGPISRDLRLQWLTVNTAPEGEGKKAKRARKKAAQEARAAEAEGTQLMAELVPAAPSTPEALLHAAQQLQAPDAPTTPPLVLKALPKTPPMAPKGSPKTPPTAPRTPPTAPTGAASSWQAPVLLATPKGAPAGPPPKASGAPAKRARSPSIMPARAKGAPPPSPKGPYPREPRARGSVLRAVMLVPKAGLLQRTRSVRRAAKAAPPAAEAAAGSVVVRRAAKAAPPRPRRFKAPVLFLTSGRGEHASAAWLGARSPVNCLALSDKAPHPELRGCMGESGHVLWGLVCHPSFREVVAAAVRVMAAEADRPGGAVVHLHCASGRHRSVGMAYLLTEALRVRSPAVPCETRRLGKRTESACTCPRPEVLCPEVVRGTRGEDWLHAERVAMLHADRDGRHEAAILAATPVVREALLQHNLRL